MKALEAYATSFERMACEEYGVERLTFGGASDNVKLAYGRAQGIRLAAERLATLRAALTPPADEPGWLKGMDEASAVKEITAQMGVPPADDEVEEIRARNRRNLQEVTDVSDLLRHVDRLSAELAKERERRGEVDGWQPIETAPKDGTRVLVWSVPIANYYNADEPPHVAIAYWLERRPNEIRMGFHSGWVWHGMAGCTFTHWRPLPTPPATQHEDTP